MSSGSQARWLAPIALVAVLLAVAFVVTSSSGDGSDDQPAASQEDAGRTSTGRTSTGESGGGSQGGGDAARTQTTSTTSERERYTVQTGDTFGSIAEETGVSVEELQELNPAVDPQSLTVGQEIRLSR